MSKGQFTCVCVCVCVSVWVISLKGGWLTDVKLIIFDGGGQLPLFSKTEGQALRHPNFILFWLRIGFLSKAQSSSSCYVNVEIYSTL